MKKGKSIIFLDNYRFRLPTNSILLNIFYNVFIQQKNNFYYKFSIIPKINKILMKNSINDTIIYPLDLESSKKLLSKKIQFKNYTTFYEKSFLDDSRSKG